MTIETGVAYFDVRTLRHVRADLADMVEHGCTYVVHCFTETDLAFYRETMADVVKATHEAGLEAWLDPWGVAAVFSGESFSRFPLEHPEARQLLSDGRRAIAACPNHPATREFLRQWTEAACATGADVLFWDEPHFYFNVHHGDFSGAWGCRCEECQQAFHEHFSHPMPDRLTDEVIAFRQDSLLELLSDLCRLGHERGLRNALCLIPSDHRRMGFPQIEERFAGLVAGAADREDALAGLLHFGIDDWDTAAAIADLDIFGCDPYWYIWGAEPEPFMRTYSQWAAEAARRYGRDLQLWVQAFRVPAGREEELRTGLAVAAEVGATHVAAWAYEGTASMSCVRCARPDEVWRIIGEEFTKLRSGGS